MILRICQENGRSRFDPRADEGTQLAVTAYNAVTPERNPREFTWFTMGDIPHL